MPTIKQIADEINNRSKNFEIGKLQEIRTRIHKKRQTGEKIFSNITIFDGYAFHHGGRKELQYNIGKENDIDYRHGVAFSLERTQTLPEPVKTLKPKIQKFNEYMKLYSKEYSDMRLWYKDKGEFKAHKEWIIPKHAIQPEAFIFFGKLQKENSFSYDEILSDFDRLLPLYVYVESKIKPEIEKVKGLVFSPGYTPKKKKATKVTKERIAVDVDLRHNLIQERLYNHLVKKYGEKSVGTECLTVGGNKIDIVVNLKDEVIYYEIKTALTAKTSIRESLSQLLEYSYWPGGTEASKLVIASEASLDNKAEQYLKKLRQKFSIPIYYEQVKID